MQKGADAAAIKACALKHPEDVVTMREEIVSLVKNGTTTIEEAQRILYSME